MRIPEYIDAGLAVNGAAFFVDIIRVYWSPRQFTDEGPL